MSFYVETAEFENVFCFRGHHKINLEPKAYAITAVYESKSGRSNWGGKTSLMSLLGPFVLFGIHDADSEDAWITDGEARGWASISIRTSDNRLYRIKRGRTRGKSTQLEVTTDETTVGQKGAQDFIEKILGLSEADFEASSLVAQEMAKKLLSSNPKDRLDRDEALESWFQLDKLDDCLQLVKSEYRNLLKDEAQAVATLSQLTDKLQRTEPSDELEGLLQGTLNELVILGNESRDCWIKAKEATGSGKDPGWRKEAVKKLEVEIKALADKILSLNTEDIPNVEATLKEANRNLDSKISNVNRLKVLANEFDGKCPVLSGFECPAKAEINKNKNLQLEELETNQTERSVVQLIVDELTQKLSELRANERQKIALQTELTNKKLQVANHEDAISRYVPGESPDEWLAKKKEVDNKINQYLGMERELRAQLAWNLDLENSIGKQALQLQSMRNDIAALREAVEVFKASKMQIAKDNLSEIESDANFILETCDIDLQISCQWAKTGSEAAKACDSCGEPYPKSLKYKECERCGTKRGKHTIDRLDIKPSAVSGGARNLGGLALQLAASKWLRNNRDSLWGVIYLDEPLASLDESNRRDVSRKLAGMLTASFGFTQSFLVAHTSDAIDAMAGKIEIRVDNSGRRSIRVI